MFQRNPKVEEAPLQSELMLFNPSSSQFYLLNSTMAYIWKNCADQNTEALIEGMTASFDGIDTGAAEAGVRQAIADLIVAGLVVDEPSGNV